MSGAKRNIEAKLNRGEAVPYSEYKKAFSPESIRAEKGTADKTKKK